LLIAGDRVDCEVGVDVQAAEEFGGIKADGPMTLHGSGFRGSEGLLVSPDHDGNEIEGAWAADLFKDEVIHKAGQSPKKGVNRANAREEFGACRGGDLEFVHAEEAPSTL